MTAPPPSGELREHLKTLIIEVCDLDDVTPADISDDERLIAGPLDLNSLDAVEIAAAIDDEYGVRIKDLSAAKSVFRSVGSLADHIAQRMTRQAG